MEKIKWCGKISKGIKLVQPSDVIAEEYMQRSRESFEILRCIQKTLSMMWLATTKYYIRYFAVYAVMRKLGIKSEIHNCTIAIAQFLEKENIFKKGVAKKLEIDKELRIENQYYLKNNPVNIDLEELSQFFIQINQNLKSLTKNKIKEIREKLSLILED